MIHDTLVQLSEGRSLTEEQSEQTFRAVLSGEADGAQIGALLGLLALKMVTVDELVGAARAMREAVLRVPIPEGLREGLVDTCGTGGAPKTFNISTAAAIAAAAAGTLTPRPVRVAKHGSKSRTGRGSSEVMKRLGVNIDASPAQQARCLAECSVCFSFAINHHPAMKHAAGPRASIGFPSIFNLLGPLTNPAGADRQVMGVYADDKLDLVAQALRRLGAHKAWVVHARDGLDEISTTAPTMVAEVTGKTPDAAQQSRERALADSPSDRAGGAGGSAGVGGVGGVGGVKIVELDVAKMGIPRATLDDLKETTLDGAADRIRRVLSGERGPARDIVSINAAAAVLVAGATDTLKQALDAVNAALDDGAAARTLDSLARLSHEPA